MWIDQNIAKAIKVKRALDGIGIKKLADKLNTTYTTLRKVERGNYDLSKRIYDSLMNWLSDSDINSDKF